MKPIVKIISALTLVSALGAGAALATGALRLPTEVRSASVKVPEGAETQADFARYTKIDRTQAEQAALAAVSGEVIRAKLDDEDGYLVWQVDVRTSQGLTEVMVDAGNGKVLAAEAEEEGEDEDA